MEQEPVCLAWWWIIIISPQPYLWLPTCLVSELQNPSYVSPILEGAQQPGLSWFLGSWAGPARCPCLDHVPSGWDPQQVDLGVCLGAPPCSSKDRFDLFRGVAAKFSLESPALTPLLSQNCCLAISAWASLQRRCFQREPYSPHVLIPASVTRASLSIF